MDLRRFLINPNLSLSTSEYYYWLLMGRVKHARFLKSHNHCLPKVSWFNWNCRVFFSYLFFPPSRFSLLFSGSSLPCLPHFVPPASRKKTRSKKDSLCFERNTRRRTERNFANAAQWSENLVDSVSERSLFAKEENFFQRCFLETSFSPVEEYFKELHFKGN